MSQAERDTRTRRTFVPASAAAGAPTADQRPGDGWSARGGGAGANYFFGDARKRGEVRQLYLTLDKTQESNAIIDEIERIKASIRAKVEHPFRVIKRQFGFTKVRYRGLMKNTAALVTMFALSNLWMARRRLLAMTAEVRL